MFYFFQFSNAMCSVMDIITFNLLLTYSPSLSKVQAFNKTKNLSLKKTKNKKTTNDKCYLKISYKPALPNTELLATVPTEHLKCGWSNLRYTLRVKCPIIQK